MNLADISNIFKFYWTIIKYNSHIFDGFVKSTLLENVGLIWGSKIIRHP
jgi:hypothetical protein